MKDVTAYVSRQLCDNQFGFRQRHSTYMALLNIVTKYCCHVLNDDNVAADLPLQLTLCADYSEVG